MAHLGAAGGSSSLGFLSGPTWPKRYDGDGMESSSVPMPETSAASASLQHVPYPAFDSKSCIPPLSLSGRSSPQLPSLCLTQPLHLNGTIASTAGEGAPSSSPASTTAAPSELLNQRPTSVFPMPHSEATGEQQVVTPPFSQPSFKAPSLHERKHSPTDSLRPAMPGAQTTAVGHGLRLPSPLIGTSSIKNSPVSPDAACPIELEHLRSVTSGSSSKVPDDRSEENWQALLKEKEEMRRQLEVQRKSNSELKRLLVASIGADLQERFDSLCQEKAENTESLSVLRKELQLQSERVEHLAIQCDVYQSKYRASSVMIEELSSLQGSLQSSLVESRGVIHELLTEQRQVFGDLQFSYQQLSSACLRLQDSMNTTSAVPSLYSGASPSTAPGHFEITTQQLSRHCIQLAAWCSKHLASLLQAIRGPSGTPSLPAVGESKQQKAHHVHVAMPDPHAQSLDNVQWRPSNAEAIAHQAITTQLPHYSTSRSPVAAAKGVASAPLGLSSTWRTLDYSTYAGCSQCKGQVQIV